MPDLKFATIFNGEFTSSNEEWGEVIRTTRLPKVIWEQAASPPLVADPLIPAAHNRSTVFARSRQCARSSNTQFLGPTPASSVQPLLHSWRRILSLCDVTLCTQFTQNLPLPVGGSWPPFIHCFILSLLSVRCVSVAASIVCHYFAPGRDAKYCDEYVCLSVCPFAQLENHTAEFHQFFVRCLRPLLGPLSTAL